MARYSTDEDEGVMLRAIPSEYHKLLIKRGCGNNDLLFRSDKFDVTDALCKINLDVFGATSKVIATAKQARTLERVMAHPIRGSYTLGISSFPSDQRAKHVASYLMYLACVAHARSHRAGRSLPLWHKVYGSYKDQLRDEPRLETPSLLIISNITEESTPMKMEKVRDLLEKYDNIPRIVVCGGMDAASLFANRLHYPVDGVLHLGPPNKLHQVG